MLFKPIHAINAWNAFKINTMGDYHDLHLKTDVLLMTGVFDWCIINLCLEHCRLDPCHYFSSPGLIQDATLKMTGIELELISGVSFLKKE